MNRRNYQKELEAELSNIEKEGRAPTLFLHSCCAPCSSYVLEYLSRYFTITVFYYNPNISPASEYEERAREQERLIREMETVHPVRFLCGEYRPELFYEAVKGLEQEPEGGARCTECFKLRLLEAARLAKEGGFQLFYHYPHHQSFKGCGAVKPHRGGSRGPVWRPLFKFGL